MTTPPSPGRRNRIRSSGPRDGSRRDAGRTPHHRTLTPEQVAARTASVPAIHYPDQLPVSARREEIACAISENQVVIVSGETGSGKTTQLPKICLELGRGITGLIGHTQPRRIAARTVAERIAEELGVQLGTQVGYQVRFTDVVSDATLVKLMTDGILLAEIQRDPLLTRYDTIIIDEAHERSLNIDFLLGYLSNLLPQRPDLKLIITSATIDSERFAAHFGPRTADAVADRSPKAPAPVVEVTGRTYPVEIRYRPLTPEMDVDARATSSPAAGSSGAGQPSHASPAAPSGRSAQSALPRPASHAGTRAEPLDQFTAICLAADELMAEGPGDVLVFLSGEREIRDAESALIEHLGDRYVPAGDRTAPPSTVEIVPLYARLTAAEQHRVFEPHVPRRIVLATNVAETSLTVPGIRYVVDPGTARISRYSTRTKVQRLPIEPVSQASANQRSGRCGRVADGVAIRLYSEADYHSRPEFTEPEILRTSLASVILQMAALGLGDVEQFPFVEAPDTRAVRDGVAQLVEIGAIEEDRRGGSPSGGPGTMTTADGRAPSGGPRGPRLTAVGRKLATLPIDPRLGRMLLEGEANGCASEILVIVAALSVQDVRERPLEKQAQADQAHARFTDPTSDFLAYLNLWRYLRVRQRDLSSSAFRRACRAEYLNFLRFREWQDVVSQLRQLARPMGLRLHPIALPAPALTALDPVGAVLDQGRSADTPAADQIHRSLLVGLLGNLGTWLEKTREYEGARGTKFTIWPGSGLAKKRYNWVMAAELVETARLFARTVARIDGAWIEPAAEHLVRRVYSEPYWSSRQGAAMVHEKVLLYGMTIVADRTVPLTRLNTVEARELARELFIRHALVEGEWRSHHRFLAENARLRQEAHEFEERTRQRGLVADEEAIEEFYSERIPAAVTSARHFDTWWKRERAERPDLLTFTRELLLPGAHDSGADAFPLTWTQGDLTLPLSYVFSPGAKDDGVTVTIPISVLARVREDGFDWLVPGLLPELAVATIRALPKKTRTQLVPAPDTAAAILGLLPPWEEGARGDGPGWTEAFARAVRELKGFVIPPEDFDAEALPSHLRVVFRVLGEDGRELKSSTSLAYLQRTLAAQTRTAVRSAVRDVVRDVVRAEARDVVHAEASGGDASAGRALGAGSAGGAAGRAASDGGSAGAVGGHMTSDGGGAAAGGGFVELPDLSDFPLDTIPSTVTSAGAGGFEVRGYPALVVEQAERTTAGGRAGSGASGGKSGASSSGVALRILASAGEQAAAHAEGVTMLALARTRLATERVSTRWTGTDALTLASAPHRSTAELVEDVQRAAAQAIAARWQASNTALDAVRTREQFESLVLTMRQDLEDEVYRTVALVVRILSAWREVDAAIRGASSLALLNVVTDVRDQVAALVFPGFVSRTPGEWLVHLPRYLKAAALRIERAQAGHMNADATAAWQVGSLLDDYSALLDSHRHQAPDPARDARMRHVRWLIEELRVSLFAQTLGTSQKVSDQRIRKLLAAG